VQSYGSPEERDERESIAVIHRAIELGVTFFDTARRMDRTRNEELLAARCKGRREGVIIATKFGFRYGDGRITGGFVAVALSTDPHRSGFYQHRVDRAVPIEETVGVMADLLRQGKVRFLGLSEAGEETIRRAHAVHPISALQSEYSLWSAISNRALIPLLMRAGHRTRAFCPSWARFPHGFGAGGRRSIPER